MSQDGRVEILSSEAAIGWTRIGDARLTIVTAILDGVAIGYSEANLERADLMKAAAETGLRARAFSIVYRSPVPDSRVADVQVVVSGAAQPLERSQRFRLDRSPVLRIFIFGSPRSGTSELGTTLAQTIGLPWLGEGHAAPLFDQAAKALAGDPHSANGLVRFMAQQNYRAQAIELARQAYFQMHASASFVDKTPGVPMIAAAPFIRECFPNARMIYLQRNGISNVLSRLAKFGGSFEGNCADWAAAVKEWRAVRETLPHYLELAQEDMLSKPHQVADRLAAYLEMPTIAAALAKSLEIGSRERTGAGIGRSSLAQTGWSAEQVRRFRAICGAAMAEVGYEMDAPAKTAG